MKSEADYVVVGGGSAGCVLAARLSEDPSIRVDLIEAGDEDRNIWLHIPAGWGKLMASGHHYWNYETEPETQLNGRSLTWPRGKVIGGSGAVNGLVYLRGAPIDYDGWEQDGAQGWSWNDVVPYFRRLEDWDGPQGDTRGKGGPIPVSQAKTLSKGAAAFLESCQGLGFHLHRDVNDGEIEGVSRIQKNVRNGRRISSSRGHLLNARGRPNLRIIPNTMVKRIVIKDKRAQGVLARRAGSDEDEVFLARREVILSSGVIGSPQLLMLSGIGDLGELAKLGIRGEQHLPGVGKNLQDHLLARFRYRSRPLNTLNEITNSRLRLALTAATYAIKRDGPLAAGPTEATLFAKSSPAQPEADIQVQYVNFCTSDKPGFVLPDYPGFMLTFDQCRPESRGYLQLQSIDSMVPPKIYANYLSKERDRQVMLEAAKLARKIGRFGALGALVQEEIAPTRDVVSDEELMDYLLSAAGTVYHPCGTCRMGRDDMAVVDSRLKVRGIRALRVVDASVMPRIPSSNIHAGVLMIAERAVDLIRDD